METVHWLWEQVSRPKEPVLETIWASSRKPVFRVSEKSSFKPASTATQTG